MNLLFLLEFIAISRPTVNFFGGITLNNACEITSVQLITLLRLKNLGIVINLGYHSILSKVEGVNY